MKRIIGVVLFTLLLSKPVFGQSASEGWSITSYNADITVNTDASIDVHEAIAATFTTDHHGIYRTIPDTATFNNQKVRLPISGISVKQDGQPAVFTTSDTGSNTKIQIGDSHLLISGGHVYDMYYHVAAGVNFFPTFDELNWNVTGNDWAVPIMNVKATIHLPSTAAVPTTLCYTGPKGSTAQHCTGSATAGVATYTATDTLTVVSHWPKGMVTQPTNYAQLRSTLTGSLILNWLTWAGAVAIPLLALLFMWRTWSQKGRDPQEQKTIIAQYDPPADVRPAEILAIRDQNVDSRGLSSTLVDLAVRGYLRIEEREKSVLLIGHTKDYALIRLKQSDPALRDYEQHVLDMLFQDSYRSSDGATLLSTIKHHQRTIYTEVTSINQQVLSGVTARGYFDGDPKKAKAKYIIFGSVLVVAGFAIFRTGVSAWQGMIFAGSLAASGAIVAAFGSFMSRRSEKGAQADWEIKGFKLYLETAEKYRLQWQEKQNIFETFLPFAMALGVAGKWSKTFADMNLPPPSWYSGSSAWSSIYAWQALSSFNSALSSATIPSSGGSAGGSGGGGGGGGGGGW